MRFFLAGIHRPQLWLFLAPVSGAFNTLFILLAAFFTLIFLRVHRTFRLLEEETQELRRTKSDLEKAQWRLLDLTRTLEQRVEERTQELALSEQKFRQLFECSGDAIFFCDQEGHLVDLNPAGVQLLGFARKEEVLGRSLGEFFVCTKEWQKYKEILCTEGGIKNFETWLFTARGEERYVVITANAIENAEGCRLGCQGIMKDLTRLKEMTEHFIYSEKMAALGQLAAGVAHEINTPLGIILGYTQLLRETLEDPPEELKIVEEQVRACQRLISDLLIFSRSSLSLEQEVKLHEIVEQVVEMVRPTYQKDGLQIHLHLFPVPSIQGDPDRLRQIILNLLNNARDALLQHKGSIHLWLRPGDNGTVILEVGDTGEGIPREILSHIFEPFFTTKPQGTGLGLFVTYGLVKEHGGEIIVFSPPRETLYQELGIRTLFRVILPKEAQNAAEGPSGR
ncbi:two-component system sensor histidine kinase NtrB [Thermosulfurimonas marina]|uniref:two-component system sensor histidine kinase NtrB n=1 Tax=Thermosulfurimonas marina TaxID=2047767 RepID=UPI001B316587|nr:ATP-binding protein [Thermosulfurimonas marina]